MRPLLFVFLVGTSAVAAPRDFPFTWTSQTQDVGKSQFEFWLTPRISNNEESFARFEGRLAWTFGVAKNLESMLAFDPDITRTLLTEGMSGKVTNLWRWTTWRSGAPFGVGGVGRVSVGLDVLELEARLLADLKLDRVLFALNVSGERSLFWNGRSGVNTRLEESLAVRFALSSTATFGLETRVKSSWEDRAYRGTAVYVGPTLSWSHERFWVSLGGLAQVAAERGDGERGAEEPLELSDNERFVLRLSAGLMTW